MVRIRKNIIKCELNELMNYIFYYFYLFYLTLFFCELHGRVIYRLMISAIN